MISHWLDLTAFLDKCTSVQVIVMILFFVDQDLCLDEQSENLRKNIIRNPRSRLNLVE